jgi:anthranilate synthase component 2/anthranilate synthase/phosphoribosyltransferase
VTDRPAVVIVDNFDSFTFNLVDEFARRGCDVEVWRNTTSPERLAARAGRNHGAGLLVLSPGPGAPSDAGHCVALVKDFGARIPVFGVCLGHQAIVEAYDGEVGPAGEVIHGRASQVTHDGDSIFAGIPSPFTVGRYHSLAGRALRAPMRPIAWCGSVVMAACHDEHPVIGAQFHPESILTPDGGRLIENVLEWAVRQHEGAGTGSRDR